MSDFILPDQLEVQARAGVRVAGTSAGIRRWLNFIEGHAIDISAADDPTGEEVEITIAFDESELTLSSIDHGGLGGLADDDHPQYVAHALADAKGDLLVASADGDWNRKAAGSDYTLPQWLAAATDGVQAGPTTQTWTPTLAQGASTDISKTVNIANYWRVGPLVYFHVKVTATAAGTAGSAITVTLPVTGTSAAVNAPCGDAAYLDTGTAQYPSIPELASTTTLAMYRADVTVAGYIGASPNIAVASGDIFYAHGFYLAA